MYSVLTGHYINLFMRIL